MESAVLMLIIYSFMFNITLRVSDGIVDRCTWICKLNLRVNIPKTELEYSPKANLSTFLLFLESKNWAGITVPQATAIHNIPHSKTYPLDYCPILLLRLKLSCNLLMEREEDDWVLERKGTVFGKQKASIFWELAARGWALPLLISCENVNKLVWGKEWLLKYL